MFNDIQLPETCIFLRKRHLSTESRKALDEVLHLMDTNGLNRDQSVISGSGCKPFSKRYMENSQIF